MSRNPVPDPAQMVDLLWRAPVPRGKSPGPRPRLDVEAVVQAGIAVADADPWGGVSMRAVAEELGVTAMTIYGYVPGKEALLALMYDAVHAGMPALGIAGWRREVTVWAGNLLDRYVRHPWALRLAYARPVLGPHEQQVLEQVVEALRPCGLGAKMLRPVIGMLFHMVRGTALTIAEARHAGETSGVSDTEWWRQSSAALSAAVPDFADRFPQTTWLLSEPSVHATARDYVDHQARQNLEGGLEVLLDGVKAATDRAQSRD